MGLIARLFEKAWTEALATLAVDPGLECHWMGPLTPWVVERWPVSKEARVGEQVGVDVEAVERHAAARDGVDIWGHHLRVVVTHVTPTKIIG